MEKKFNRVLSVILVVLMLLSAVPFSASAASTVISGDCGDNLTWKLDSSGVLSIGGTGKTYEDFDNYWDEHSGKIKAVVIGSGVTSMDYGAFKYCYKLTKITVSSDNKYYSSVGGVLFNKAKTKLILYPKGSSANAYTIPNSVTSIGDYAFYGCESLAKITIPDSVTSIGEDAFSDTAYYNNKANWSGDVLYNGQYLIAVDYDISGDYSIKSGTKCIADMAFSYCDSLTKITVSSANKYYSSVGGVLFNKTKTKLIQYPKGSSANAYIIPNGVKSIGNRAFSYCSITSITIPNSVTSIGYWAFSSCDSLTSITIPNSVTSIADYAFEYCDSLTSITIADSVISIGNSAFKYCEGLTSVTIGNGVTKIGENAFSFCNKLTELSVSSDNIYYTSVSGVLFNKSKTKLIWYPLGSGKNYYKIPDSVTSIDASAFYNCDNLKGIKIPDSVTSIDESAFYNCDNLKGIKIPKNVTSIGDRAFSYCDNLSKITVSSANEHYSSVGGVLFNKAKTELIQYPRRSRAKAYIIPDSVTSISDRAFPCCLSLTSITIPNSNSY